MASPGKLEARITVPANGWAVSIEDDIDTYVVTIPAGEYYHSSVGSGSNDFAAEVAAQCNALASDTVTVSVSAAAGGTGKYTISGSGTGFGVTWTETALRDVLGFTATIGWGTGNSHTGTNQAQALWLPGYPFQTVGGGTFPGKIVTDQQNARNAKGHFFSIYGQKYREKAISWPMEAAAKVRADAETLTNASFETFLIDGIYGEAAWGTSGGPVRFYADASIDGTYLSYAVDGMQTWDPNELIEHWAGGLWPVVLPMLVQVPE